ncbi:hypothetical protein D3C71_2170520 [compost metagenome]
MVILQPGDLVLRIIFAKDSAGFRKLRGPDAMCGSLLAGTPVGIIVELPHGVGFIAAFA